MAPCDGTSITTVCTETFTIRSANGMISRRPGCRMSGSRRPNRSTTPRSYCCTSRTLAVSTSRTRTTTIREINKALTGTPPNEKGTGPAEVRGQLRRCDRPYADRSCPAGRERQGPGVETGGTGFVVVVKARHRGRGARHDPHRPSHVRAPGADLPGHLLRRRVQRGAGRARPPHLLGRLLRQPRRAAGAGAGAGRARGLLQLRRRGGRAAHPERVGDDPARGVLRRVASGAARPPYGGSSATSWPTPRAWCAPPT